jgi:hypothetical protein
VDEGKTPGNGNNPVVNMILAQKAEEQQQQAPTPIVPAQPDPVDAFLQLTDARIQSALQLTDGDTRFLFENGLLNTTA